MELFRTVGVAMESRYQKQSCSQCRIRLGRGRTVAGGTAVGVVQRSSWTRCRSSRPSVQSSCWTRAIARGIRTRDSSPAEYIVVVDEARGAARSGCTELLPYNRSRCGRVDDETKSTM